MWRSTKTELLARDKYIITCETRELTDAYPRHAQTCECSGLSMNHIKNCNIYVFKIIQLSNGQTRIFFNDLKMILNFQNQNLNSIKIYTHQFKFKMCSFGIKLRVSKGRAIRYTTKSLIQFLHVFM